MSLMSQFNQSLIIIKFSQLCWDFRGINHLILSLLLIILYNLSVIYLSNKSNLIFLFLFHTPVFENQIGFWLLVFGLSRFRPFVNEYSSLAPHTPNVALFEKHIDLSTAQGPNSKMFDLTIPSILVIRPTILQMCILQFK